jgi:glycosyltransferase involved in cell wall biosynthesis
VFVLPSWFEGMPLSLLEAMAAGLPVVASGVCGVLDVIRPDQAGEDGGRLVRPHDAADLHEALDGLVRDPALRSTLGERARERASGFTWTRSADALEKIYRQASSSG